jgi:cysteine synthase B
VEIARLNPHCERARIYAKLESRNPGGSVKDRAARAILRAAVEQGKVAPGGTLLDATSGNTGIAYAMLAAPVGIRCHLVMPANASPARVALMRAYGAHVELTDPLEGQDGAVDRARQLSKDPSFFYADQYANPANPEAHALTTAPEIWRQTEGAVTHFVAGLGTSGTAMGTTRGLRALAPTIRCVGVEPTGPFHGVEGLKHMASAHVPPIFRPEELDERRSVVSERAVELGRRLAREEGLFVGTSSGAALAGAIDVASEAPAGSVIVTIFPDGGERYL